MDGLIALNLWKRDCRIRWLVSDNDFAFANTFDLNAAAPSLRSLTLRQVVDYGEIEAILLGCKTLEELRFEGGIDNLVSDFPFFDTPC